MKQAAPPPPGHVAFGAPARLLGFPHRPVVPPAGADDDAVKDPKRQVGDDPPEQERDQSSEASEPGVVFCDQVKRAVIRISGKPPSMCRVHFLRGQPSPGLQQGTGLRARFKGRGVRPFQFWGRGARPREANVPKISVLRWV